MKSLAREDDVAEIRRRVESLTAVDERLWGSMSVAEMVCHVREAFRVAIGEVRVTLMPPPLPAAVVKRMALWAPIPWPKGVTTVPELRVGGTGIRPEEFAADRAGLLDAFEVFRRKTDNVTVHSIFGSMQPEDWMRWGYLHTDHHLRQFGR